MTLAATLAAARERLIRSDFDAAEAAVDVDVYARTILGWDRAQLLTNLTTATPANLEPQFSEWLSRRERHEPTAYILGNREFWGLDFKVTPAVLIPRPETEFIVEEAVPLVRAMGAGSFRLVDVGTGSGCIAVALARELPACRVIGTDVSAEALVVAQENAERHGTADRLSFICTSFLDDVDGPFDLIAANPPYVREVDKPALSPDVKHEPEVALFGGATGLRDLDSVLAAAEAKLRPGGWLVMEFGFGQEDDVRDLASRYSQLRFDRVREDLQGLARTSIIQKS